MRLFSRLKNQINEIQWFFQRGSKGYCDKDIWCICHWMSTTFVKMLEEYHKVNISYPDRFSEKLKDAVLSGKVSFLDDSIFAGDENTKDYDYEVWQNAVLEMSRLFKRTNIENGTVTDEEARENLKQALELLKICYFDLFW